MKAFRNLRIALAVIFVAASAVLLLALWPPTPMVRFIGSLQFAPSRFLVKGMAATALGTTLFWLAVSFMFGRFYCATLCPVGLLTDVPVWIRRRMPKFRRPFRFRQKKRLGADILCVYIVTLVLANPILAYIIEPWQIFRNILTPVNPGIADSSWISIGAPAAVGLIAGILSLAALLVWAWFSGREFCNTVCPLGAAMGIATRFAPVAIEIDPDRCINCMKCEEECPASCVKVVSRYVDNTRCVRCMECLAACPVNAIGFTTSRMRPATPLFTKVKKVN